MGAPCLSCSRSAETTGAPPSLYGGGTGPWAYPCCCCCCCCCCSTESYPCCCCCPTGSYPCCFCCPTGLYPCWCCPTEAKGYTIFELWHEKFVTSKAIDQTAHARILIRALLVTWMLYDCYATDWTPFGVSKLKNGLQRLVWVYTCQNTTVFGITCHGSFILTINGSYAVKHKRTFDLAQLVVITKIAIIMRPQNTALSSVYDINGHTVLVCWCSDNPTLSGSQGNDLLKCASVRKEYVPQLHIILTWNWDTAKNKQRQNNVCQTFKIVKLWCHEYKCFTIDIRNLHIWSNHFFA